MGLSAVFGIVQQCRGAVWVSFVSGRSAATRCASSGPLIFGMTTSVSRRWIAPGFAGDAVVRHGALEAGAPYLQKPLTPSTLTQKVRSVLDA